MPNVRIKKINPIAGRCIETILGTVRCPVCENQMCIEVSNAGDHQSSARFIYHEKLGGGYCPGSEVNAEKLQAMTEIIVGIQNLGFVIADIINYDPAGEVQRIIAYLPDRAMFMLGNVIDGRLITASITGQLRQSTLVDSSEFVNKWTMKGEVQVTCHATRIDEGYLCIEDQGLFVVDKSPLSSFDRWIQIVKKLIDQHKKDLALYFCCNCIVFYFARCCPCDNNTSYSKELASVINKSVANKLPKTMFSGNTRLITKVR